jgi:hypothetical protein
MGLLQIAALGAAGYLGYRYYRHTQRHEGKPAFAAGETDGANFAKVAGDLLSESRRQGYTGYTVLAKISVTPPAQQGRALGARNPPGAQGGEGCP